MCYKVSNTCYKLCNMRYKLCNKNFKVHRKNFQGLRKNFQGLRKNCLPENRLTDGRKDNCMIANAHFQGHRMGNQGFKGGGVCNKTGCREGNQVKSMRSLTRKFLDIFGCARQYEQALLHSLARKLQALALTLPKADACAAMLEKSGDSTNALGTRH